MGIKGSGREVGKVGSGGSGQWREEDGGGGERVDGVAALKQLLGRTDDLGGCKGSGE